MSGKYSLLEAFNQTAYPVPGHGKRNVQALKDVLQEIDGDVSSDVYGSGQVIEDFQNKMAAYLGKDTAVFFPSGTMAQQIALRIWCEEKGLKKVAYHPLSHLEIHEEDGLRELHGIDSVLLADKNRVIELDDVLNMTEDVACLLLELPQREIGGQLPAYKDLEAISASCREKGIKLHLDGARLFEVLPFYEKTAAEICQLFDSVYVSFYKGIGGLAGAILAGSEAFTKQSKVWKRRHGGDLISLYPYFLSADFYFDQRVNKMAQYYEEAIELAALYNQCQAVETRPLVPVSNMFHVHFARPKEQVERILISVYEATGIGLSGNVRAVDEASCFYEISIGDRYATVPKEPLSQAFRLLDQKLRQEG
ncbi:MAG: aminotransferase class I/II-fold pyridoxal phosphate-dependent enzyme [Tumebacillaceae bacterium]